MTRKLTKCSQSVFSGSKVSNKPEIFIPMNTLPDIDSLRNAALEELASLTMIEDGTLFVWLGVVEGDCGGLHGGAGF